jgi:hypothetical protein
MVKLPFTGYFMDGRELVGLGISKFQQLIALFVPYGINSESVCVKRTVGNKLKRKNLGIQTNKT